MTNSGINKMFYFRELVISQHTPKKEGLLENISLTDGDISAPTTQAPCWSNSSTVAKPIPEALPETIAT